MATTTEQDRVRELQRALYRAAKADPHGGSRMPAVKNVGEPCAGEPHARFEVAAGGNLARRHCRAALAPPLHAGNSEPCTRPRTADAPDRAPPRGPNGPARADEPDTSPLLRATETTTSARPRTALDLTTYAEAPAARAASRPSSLLNEDRAAEKDDATPRLILPDQPRRLNPIQTRHHDIDRHHIGAQRRGLPHRAGLQELGQPRRSF